MAMTSEILALRSAVAVTPNDPDQGRRDQQQARRRRPGPPQSAVAERPAATDEPIEPPVVGTRLNVRV
jgi:hypothetical protein